MKWLLALIAMTASAQTQVLSQPGKSPLITLRLVFRTGSASDPAGKEGLANLTAAMLAEGGNKQLTYSQILDAFFPMATGVRSQVDKEMTTFAAETHVDNLDAFYKIFRGMLLEPGWREEDFRRLKDEHINYLRISLRSNNDEELGKEVLYNTIYAGHPYGHHNVGTVSGLNAITIADLQDFYKKHFTRSNLTIAIAGGYPPAFLEQMKKDFAALPQSGAPEAKIPAAPPLKGVKMVLVDKPTRSVAYSLGFPITVRRGDPDWPALLVMQSWFGQHRSSGGRLYNRMREIRGLNYGDYAYIEYFPRGMYLMEPEQNLGRQQQIFQMWIRPVERPTAHFALRLALFELDRLIHDGITKEDLDQTRNFLIKNANILTRTKLAELGYLIDSKYYGIPPYGEYLKTTLSKLTVDDVNRAIKKHLQMQNMVIVAVTPEAAEFEKMIVSDAPSPMTYNSPKPDDILAEDKLIQSRKLGLKASDITIVPVNTVFE